MNFFKNKENLIITGVVLAFFSGMLIWLDVLNFSAICAVWRNADSGSYQHLVFKDGNDHPVSLAKFKGKPLVVNLWATWCPVCVKKMGSLNSLAGKMKRAGGEVIAISNDRQGIGVVKSFLTRHNYHNLHPYVDSTAGILQAFGVRGIPMTLLVNANGEVVDHIQGGFDWDSEEAHELIEEKLGVKIQ